MTELRPYQKEAVANVLQNWREGHRKTLLNMATGTGKTIVFSSVLAEKNNQGGRALVLAHRSELLDQAEAKIGKVCGLKCSLEKADSHSLESEAPITLGSVQTLSNSSRLKAFPSDHFDTIVVDEAHHTMSDSYLRILDHFPDAEVLGVTATPDRADKRNLGQYYDTMAYEYPMSKAILDGYLCPIKAQMIPLKLDISRVSVTNGDFSANELGHALEPYLHMIADEMKKYCQGRKTVVFLPLVSTSQKFRDILEEKGFLAAEVNGTTPDRETILKDFEDGRYEVLCNSMLLTEGWDCPSVDCIVCLRPTKIRSLYQQIVGRGTRLAEGKENLLLLDFLWHTERHDLCKPSSLLSKDDEIAARVDKAVESGDEVDLLEESDQAAKDIVAEREASLAKVLGNMKNRSRQLVDPLQYALSLGDEELLRYIPTFAWEMEPATDKQLQALENLGIDPESVQNKGHASKLMDRLNARRTAGLATPKQIRFLERKGFIHVGMWRLTDANAMVSRISSNGWMVPRGIVPARFVPSGGLA